MAPSPVLCSCFLFLLQGEDSVEYFLGLTPSGIVVLRNKTTVAYYYWPRIAKVYFKGRYFMLRVCDKNVSINVLLVVKWVVGSGVIWGFQFAFSIACEAHKINLNIMCMAACTYTHIRGGNSRFY